MRSTWTARREAIKPIFPVMGGELDLFLEQNGFSTNYTPSSIRASNTRTKQDGIHKEQDDADWPTHRPDLVGKAESLVLLIGEPLGGVA